MAVDEQVLAKPKRISAKAARAAREMPVSPPAISAPAAEDTAQQEVTRREFLNYAWLASLGIFLAQMGAVSYHFAFPRFKAGEFGGTFSVPITELPELTAGPGAYNQGKFWLVNTEQGILAIYKVCTHLGCLYDWKPTENQFICPCHGSTFEKNGKFVRGPAPRDLDRFMISIKDANGTTLAASNEVTGAPVALPSGATSIAVDTGKLVQGPRHA